MEKASAYFCEPPIESNHDGKGNTVELRHKNDNPRKSCCDSSWIGVCQYRRLFDASIIDEEKPTLRPEGILHTQPICDR